MAVPDAAAPGVVVALVAAPFVVAPVPADPVAAPVWPDAELPEVLVAAFVADPEVEPEEAA